MKLKRDGDEVAEEVVGEEARVIDPEVERRVVRKIDMFLMPAMVIGRSPNLLTSLLAVKLWAISSNTNDLTDAQVMGWYTTTR